MTPPIKTTAASQPPDASARPAQSASHFALQAILAGLAHDLNNPLNSISTNAELALLLAQRSSEKTAEVLQRIISDCRRCAAVIQNLVEASRLDVTPVPTDLGEILAAARAGLLEELDLQPQAIVLERPNAPLMVLADAGALIHASRELLLNAVQAGARRVTMIPAVRGSSAVVEFADDGAGMPAELAGRLLKSYYLPRPGKSGAGLGLGIARRLILDHAGKLELADATPGHTAFLMTLPLHVPAPD